jgi:hypothetical protein
MLKRQGSGSKAVRKKRKGNATFESYNFNPNNKTVENVRVWDISSSEKTGRIKASRRTLKHYSQLPPSEESSTSKNPGRTEVNVTEVNALKETGVLADAESPSDTVKKKDKKRRRIRTVQENDDVSALFFSRHLKLIRDFRQKWSSGFSIDQYFSTNCYVWKV